VFGQATGEILPLAVAVAISPLSVAAVIVMLLSSRAGVNSVAFVAGWVLGLAAVGAIVLVFGSAFSSDGNDGSIASGAAKAGFGALFLLLAVHSWFSRSRSGKLTQTPKWLLAVDRFDIVQSLGVGFLLSGVNPKNLALTIAAASSIAAATLSSGAEIAVFALFMVIACATVITPVAYYALAPRRARRELEVLKTWLIAHNPIVMAVLFVLIGAKLLGDGITILS